MSGFKHQYPPQTGHYAVKVKRGNSWKEFASARFHISVGQPYHEGEKFAATMAWAKRRFEQVIICVNDTLQRHNYHFNGMEETAALELAQVRGNEWIDRNSRAFSNVPHVELYRWEHWRNHPDYACQYDKINQQYQAGRPIRKAIDDEVMLFWQRRQKNGLVAAHRLGAFQHYSTQYLIEECAAFCVMFQQDEAVDVYPGSVLLPCALFKNESSLGKHGFTRIDFSRNKDFQPHRCPTPQQTA
ncbi:MAG: tRNA-dependent cyclodipeptide synthase [Candidatus Competibacteraceae bacterium]|nr:tRNA-dependent cyclodipeptide synthase [Candidatus Competibacteraceae bacterium]